MKHVLVTGGAGYIGSHTCKALVAAGCIPVTFDDFSTGHRSLVKWGPSIQGDIRDTAAIKAALLQFRPFAVIHFAGRIAVGESVTHPAVHYDINVGGTLSLLTAMQQTGIDRIVFSSSAAVYGLPQTDLIAESHVLAPINPYGRTKAIVETILADYRSAYGLRSVALRYFNASGADPDGQTGESHDPETHLIPLAIAATDGRQAVLSVFGDDYPTLDGTCMRDYIHVCDLADAHVVALTLLDRSECPPAVNVGTGRGYSVAQVIEAVERVTGRSVNRVVAPRRPGDPASLVADCTLLRQISTWRPGRSDISGIVSTAWKWHWHAKRTVIEGAAS